MSVVCIILGTAAALCGCGSKMESSGGSGTNSPTATAPAQNDPHVPPSAITGQAALSQQRKAEATGYAAAMKQQMAKQHKQ